MAIDPTVMKRRMMTTFPEMSDATALQVVEDAVEQLSQDVPIQTSTTLSVVSGQATYALPVDFLFLIELPALVSSDNVLLSDGGIIPIATAWEERWYIEGDVIRFEPTPSYTLTRSLRYAARHVLVNGVWPRLSENAARIALLYGRYLAMQQQAASLAEGGWRYKIGDEEIDKSRQGSAMLEQVNATLESYRAAVRQLQGYGSMHRVRQVDWIGV